MMINHLRYQVVWIQLLLIMLLVGLMTGCSTSSPAYQDYRLVAVPVSQQVPQGLPATLGVFPVKVAGWLDKKNITRSDGGVRLMTFENSHWGEPLPALLTQTMVQNIRSLSGPGTRVNSGPWGRDKRPEVVVFIDVQSISQVNQQLQVDVAWYLEGVDGKIISRQEKVYGLPLEGDDVVQANVQTLSRVWGRVAGDIIKSL